MTPAETERAREALEEPPARRAAERLPWLLVGLAGSVLATLIMARFERLLAADVTIAFFVPGIVYLADAIGTQTEAAAVRGLSACHRPFRELLTGEAFTGLLIGGALGGVAIPAIGLTLDRWSLAVAVGLAVVAAGAVATSIGLLLPWMLSRHDRDPAFASGPLATILQDLLSLLIYFTCVAALT
jgi:magnesium transporter